MGKHLPENGAKVNIPLRAAAVLVCLMLLSAYSVTGLFARYTTGARRSDQARVAKFSIKGNNETLSQNITAKLAPGDSQTVYLDIQNDSEVAVEYTVEAVNMTKNLPLSFSMVKDDDDTYEHADEGSTTFTAQQLPGRHNDKYMLNIEWKTAEEAKEKDLDLMGMVDYITVTVTAAQID